jgi:hypothetical protein
LIDRVDPRADRTNLADSNHALDGMIRPGEHGFYRSIATIAHPAIQVSLHRMVLDEGAEADALNPSANGDVLDDARIAHVYVPVIGFPSITQL